MMNFIKLNQRDITSQREALIKWRIELHHSLANKTSSAAQNFYIIEKKWLENYEKNVLNHKKDELIFNKDDYKLTNQLSEQILSSSTIYSLPEIFVLNDNTWKSIYKFFGEKSSSDNNFNSNCKKANFQNNILLFKINNLENYCFFYLDENAQINQGYLQINDKNKREEIIKAIRKNGPSELNKYNRSNNGITIIIFQTYKKNINPKIVTSPESINNNNKGNASNNMNNIHIQNNFHKDNNISNAKNYKNMNNNRNNNNFNQMNNMNNMNMNNMNNMNMNNMNNMNMNNMNMNNMNMNNMNNNMNNQMNNNNFQFQNNQQKNNFSNNNNNNQQNNNNFFNNNNNQMQGNQMQGNQNQGNQMQVNQNQGNQMQGDQNQGNQMQNNNNQQFNQQQNNNGNQGQNNQMPNNMNIDNNLSEITVIKEGNIQNKEKLLNMCKMEIDQNNKESNKIVEKLKQQFNGEYFLLIVGNNEENYEFKFSEYKDEDITVFCYKTYRIYLASILSIKN